MERAIITKLMKVFWSINIECLKLVIYFLWPNNNKITRLIWPEISKYFCILTPMKFDCFQISCEICHCWNRKNYNGPKKKVDFIKLKLLLIYWKDSKLNFFIFRRTFEIEWFLLGNHNNTTIWTDIYQVL